MHFPRTHLFRVCTTASFVAVSIRSNSVGFYYFECCCSQTLPRANATYSVCIEVPRVQVLIGMMSPPIWFLCCFDCLPSLYLNFTCMRTHTVVSSCHLNAARSLSADCLSIGCSILLCVIWHVDVSSLLNLCPGKLTRVCVCVCNLSSGHRTSYPDNSMQSEV